MTTPNPVPADYLIDVKPVDKPHGSGVDGKKFHRDVGVVGLPSDVGHEFEESAPRELVISIDSLLDSISLQLAYEGGSSVELSSAHGSIRFYTSSDEILYLDYVDGNVGIGTISPLYKLDVVGVARFSDSVKVGEYWLPREVGDSGEVLAVGGDGKLGWYSISALWDTGGGDTYPCSACVDWFYSNVHNVVYTALWETPQVCTTAFVGIARGHAGNSLYGDASTHINFGVESQTSEPGVTHEHCIITGGYMNKAIEDYCTITGGYKNRAIEDYATISGGSWNQIYSKYGYIGGGDYNFILENSDYSVIVGGDTNHINTKTSFIGCGRLNIIERQISHNDGYNVICGGIKNYVAGELSAICAGGYNKIYGRSGYHNFIGGGDTNHIEECIGSVVSGGHGNYIKLLTYGGIASGYHCTLNKADYCFIGGGSNNMIDTNATWSVIGGGEYNYILFSRFSFIGGGIYDTIIGVPEDYEEAHAHNIIVGGKMNRIRNYVDFSAVLSGDSNLITDTSSHSVIIGGQSNTIYADYAMSFGKGVLVKDDFVTAFYSENNPGKVGINRPSPHSTLHDNGSFATTCALNPIGTVGESHHSIYLNGTSPSVTLPDASTCEARIYYIKNIGPNPATVNATAPSSIEGLASYTLNPDDGIIVQAFSGNWYIIAKFP